MRENRVKNKNFDFAVRIVNFLMNKKGICFKSTNFAFRHFYWRYVSEKQNRIMVNS